MTDRARHWQALVREQERSGLTQAAFCRQREINLGTFAWWRRKFRTDTASESAVAPHSRRDRSAPHSQRDSMPDPLRFMEVEVVGARSKRYEIALPNGWVLRVPTDFDAEHVTQLVRAVALAC